MDILLTRTFERTVQAVHAGARYVDCCGGTRSGKTYAILQVLIWLRTAVDTTATLTSIVSESVPHLKRGAIRDFEAIMRRQGWWREGAWNNTDHIFTFPNGSKIEFFSADNAAKVHGAGRDDLFINEAQNVPYETARQLFVRTRGRIYIDYNPTHEFWVHKYVRGTGKEVTINSTYKDNPYLSPLQVEEIESNRGDTEWWTVYGLGLTGRRQGLVFQEWEQVDVVPRAAHFRGRGVDFGFTNDPTAIVDVYQWEDALVLDERLYRTALTNDVIARVLKELPPKSDYYPSPLPVVADSAEMKSIVEIRNYGVRAIEGAVKGAGSTNIGIDAMKRYVLKVTKDSVNLIHELRNYMWKVDKLSGEMLNVPVDRYNHAIDAARYVVATLLTTRRATAGVRWTNTEIV